MASCTRLSALWDLDRTSFQTASVVIPWKRSIICFFCPLVQSGISWVQSLLFRAAPLAPTVTIRHLLFGFSNDELLVVPLVFVSLLNVLKFQIWVMRNNHRYRQTPPGAVGLIAATKSRLRFYLPLLAKRFLSSRRPRYFKRQWGPSGVIGRFHNGYML